MFLFAEGGGHHEPLIVEFVNHYLGKPVHELQMATTHKWWTAILSRFGTTPDALFGMLFVRPASAIASAAAGTMSTKLSAAMLSSGDSGMCFFKYP